ncbi:MAG: Mrp/NBP35 family ATP-binding protein, partial [Thermoanaerobaculales bacterium]|nr:Mrp/NBP35 family ATP-binding protein [Thermoanaerobaculales bacterium]
DLEQFIVDVVWGDRDFLVIDLPQGTGDVALNLCQNVPLFGAVIVTTTQDVAIIDARKALHMFTKLEVEVLGLVENMSGYTCPECGHKEHIFGSGGGQRTAEELKTPFLGAIPLDPSIVVGGDAGNPIVIDRPNSEAAVACMEIAESLIERSEV